MVPLHDHLAAVLGRSVQDTEAALDAFVADVRAQCRSYGEASYPGLGTFRMGDSGVTFEPDPSLALIVNHRFAGLSAMEAAPSTTWAPPAAAAVAFQPPPPVAPVEVPPDADTEASPYASTVYAPYEAPASGARVDPYTLLEEEPPRRRRLLPMLLLALFLILLAVLGWWAATRWPRSQPAAPPAPTLPAPPDTTTQTDSTRLDRTGTAAQDSARIADSIRAAAVSPPATSAAPPPQLTDRPEPSRRETPPPSASRRPRQTARAPQRRPAAPTSPPARPAPARAQSAVPTPASDTTALMAALRGQEPVEAGSGGWTVVVGGKATEEEAETSARQFRLQGYRTAVLKGTTAQGAAIYRIGLGHFRTRADAQAALARLRGNLVPRDAWLLSLR